MMKIDEPDVFTVGQVRRLAASTEEAMKRAEPVDRGIDPLLLMTLCQKARNEIKTQEQATAFFLGLRFSRSEQAYSRREIKAAAISLEQSRRAKKPRDGPISKVLRPLVHQGLNTRRIQSRLENDAHILLEEFGVEINCDIDEEGDAIYIFDDKQLKKKYLRQRLHKLKT